MDLPDAGTVKTAIDGVRVGLDLFRSAIGLTKDAKELLADAGQREAITQGLAEAEKAARLAEVQVAQALGYRLCQCTFPPQIMLSQGWHPSGHEVFECSGCGKRYPSEQFFERLKEQEELLNQDPPWIQARY